ncbi:unnamed protein product [Cunninghamella blakesleeana]
MSQLSFIFEDGKGNTVDESDNDPMEVKQDTLIQVKSLTSLTEYFKYQKNYQSPVKTVQIKSEKKEIKKTSTKSYTVYSDEEKYKFIIYMIEKTPKTVKEAADKFSIHPKIANRW